MRHRCSRVDARSIEFNLVNSATYCSFADISKLNFDLSQGHIETCHRIAVGSPF
jgi:hypothetical protein